MTLCIMTVNSHYIPHVKTPAIAARVTALLDTVLHSQEESSILATLCQKSALNPFFVKVCHLQTISGSTKVQNDYLNKRKTD